MGRKGCSQSICCWAGQVGDEVRDVELRILEEWVETYTTIVIQIPRFPVLTDLRLDYLSSWRIAEEALEAWEWREMEHEIWAARYAEADMYRDTWSPPSWWDDSD